MGLADPLPDAPIDAFALKVDGGKHGILTVTHNQDVCRKTGRAVAETDGHNGKQHDFFIKLKNNCTAKQKANAKKNAKRQAAIKRGATKRQAASRIAAW